MILFFPSAGITRIRFKGMISARNYKAPHFFDAIKVSSFLKINNQNLVYFYGLVLNGWLIIISILFYHLYLLKFQLIAKHTIVEAENMKKLFEKLNYKGQERIAIINAEEDFMHLASEELINITIDWKIDPRFPYDFIIVFVKSVSEINYFTSLALHNLLVDGTLWFCFPKKAARKHSGNIDRDHGWKALNDSGFRGVRSVAIDENWSALRFRNIKYIKSLRHRFSS